MSTSVFATDYTEAVIGNVAEERVSQHKKWGPQHHPDGTTSAYEAIAVRKRRICDEKTNANVTWLDIMEEERTEAYAEVDPARLRAELVQVAAVAVAWIEDIDSRE